MSSKSIHQPIINELSKFHRVKIIDEGLLVTRVRVSSTVCIIDDVEFEMQTVVGHKLLFVITASEVSDDNLYNITIDLSDPDSIDRIFEIVNQILNHIHVLREEAFPEHDV